MWGTLSSVLGPLRYILYTAVVQLLIIHGLKVHMYADDTQAYF